MDDSNPSPFDRLLEAAERGGPAPAGLSADESIDMAIARRLFALRIDTAAPGEQPWQMHAVARVPRSAVRTRPLSPRSASPRPARRPRAT